MGGVKDLIVIEPPEESKAGHARFVFSDRYSVFDWGKMPDEIAEKGKSLCITAAYFFERLEEEGIRTHYLGIVEEGAVKRLSALKAPQECMEIKLLRVLYPAPPAQQDGAMDDAAAAGKGCYDYSVYRMERANFLIPLEVIYRNSLPEGSSVFKRLKEGSIKPEDIGLSDMPKPGQTLESPFIDVSTKLEHCDRYLKWDEAREIAGLSDDEVREIKSTALRINEIITRESRRAGLKNEDGKIEFGFDEKRRLIVVDAVGTLDECRFTYNGMPVSKEIARIFYRKTEWYELVEKAKKKGVNWKAFVGREPPPLPENLKNLISSMYKAACNEITGRTWFEDVPELGEIMDEILCYIG